MGLFDDISNSPSLALSLGGSCLVSQEMASSDYVDESLFNSKPKTFSTTLSLAPSAASEFSKTEYSGNDHAGEVDKACNVIIDEEEDEEGSPRKKLRLTKDQSAILEDSFKQNTTLNHIQKQALADRLYLRPRQVEVWFQNKRVRTKLKQTETKCELLKKCREELREENERLQREVQELKWLEAATAPFYMQLPVASTLSVCPSCERVAAGQDSSTLALAVDGLAP